MVDIGQIKGTRQVAENEIIFHHRSDTPDYCHRCDLLLKKAIIRLVSMLTGKLLFSDAVKYNQPALLPIITDNSRALGRWNRCSVRLKRKLVKRVAN